MKISSKNIPISNKESTERNQIDSGEKEIQNQNPISNKNSKKNAAVSGNKKILYIKTNK